MIKPLTDMRAAALLSHSPAAAAAAADALHVCAVSLLSEHGSLADDAASQTPQCDSQQRSSVAILLASSPVWPDTQAGSQHSDTATILQAISCCEWHVRSAKLVQTALDFCGTACPDEHAAASAIPAAVELLAASQSSAVGPESDASALCSHLAMLAGNVWRHAIPMLCDTDWPRLQSVANAVATALCSSAPSAQAQPCCSALSTAHTLRVLAAAAAEEACRHAHSAIAAAASPVLGQWHSIHQLLHAGQNSIQSSCQLGLGAPDHVSCVCNCVPWQGLM